jgi:hypothetical protein
MPKPGYKTTELALTVIGLVIIWADALKGSLPDRYAGIATAIASTGYAISRGLAKVPTPVVPPVAPTTVVPPPTP